MSKKPKPAAKSTLGGREERPSFKTVKVELAALKKSLLKIRLAREDKKGKLGDVQIAQIDAAIKEIGAATSLLECIQDHAPYGS